MLTKREVTLLESGLKTQLKDMQAQNENPSQGTSLPPSLLPSLSFSVCLMCAAVLWLWSTCLSSAFIRLNN
jgi:hypothetical protein